MDKKLYFAPEMELVEIEIAGQVLTGSDPGSLEEPTIGGSAAGDSTDPFDPSIL